MSVEEDRSEGFLSRWSRRKRELVPEEPVAAPVSTTEAAEAPLPAEPEEEFDVSLLPDIETLTAESDITLFLKKGVPEALKNAALRKMWSADPAIRDYIGPVDYQWDFNDPMGVPGFGPLGDDVDIEALLRQVIGEPKPKAVATEAGADITGAEHLTATKVECEPANEADRQVEGDISPSDSTEITEVKEVFPAEDSQTMPNPRRHGGALPL